MIPNDATTDAADPDYAASGRRWTHESADDHGGVSSGPEVPVKFFSVGLGIGESYQYGAIVESCPGRLRIISEETGKVQRTNGNGGLVGLG